jgi:glycogen debranching enzyme
MIKNKNIFFISDEKGNVSSDKIEGLYLKDTRYISNYKIMWNDNFLYGTVEEKSNIETISYLINHYVRMTIKRWALDDCLYERIYLKNEGKEPVVGELKIHHDEDFKDIFVLRNFRYGQLGEIIEKEYQLNEFKITYLGKDDIKRYVYFKGEGDIKEDNIIEYKVNLRKGEEKIFNQVWSISQEKVKNRIIEHNESFLIAGSKDITLGNIHSDSIKNLLIQSLEDIEKLKSYIDGKVFIAAGIPLYATIFGRDSIITGLQLLKRDPKILKETLEILAKYQGREVNHYLEEEPGKILHELREGELSNTKQVPFYPYYGSIDSTPLFLIGIAEYYKFTRDKEFLDNILDYASKSLNWIDTYGDKDEDGFVEYIQLSDKGFNNHGWKDSKDSIVHKNGTLASGSIALSEVQGYVYKAKVEWSNIFKELSRMDLSEKLMEEANALKKKFNEVFWMGDYFALALDGEKNKVEVVTSNPLHGLYCGIIDDEKIPLVVERAFKKDMFSPYGIRTMSNLEKPYNPLSYHNGSIWPHDNSIFALGLKKYGYYRELNLLANSIFNAGNLMKNLQIPELYAGEDLELYEAACVPQGWAAGAIVLLNDLLINI